MEKKQVAIKLIKNVIILLVGIQVCLGFLWVCYNITRVPYFAESQLYLQAAEDLVIDEYMGILYPLFLRMTSVFESSCCVVIYLIQLGVAFCAYYTFLSNVFGRFLEEGQRKVFYLLAAYIVTFPVILQCHLSVLPYSFASSMLILAMAQLKVLLEQKGPMSKMCVISIGVFWGLGGLLLPEYGVIIGIPVLVGFAIYGFKKERRWKVLLLTIFVTIFCIGSVNTLAQTPGSLGRIQKSAGSVMLSRFAWPYMERNAFFWSDEVKEVFSTTDLVQFSLYPERIVYEFGPRLEAAVGKEQANAFYWQMAKDSFMIGKKDALWAIGRDVLVTIGGPVGIQIQWLGKGISYAGWNYGRLAEYAPALSEYFVSFAGYSFDFMLLVSVILYVLQRGKANMSKNGVFLGLTILGIGIITIWYAMTGNGMQDYLKVIPINVFWCMLPACGYAMCVRNINEKRD